MNFTNFVLHVLFLTCVFMHTTFCCTTMIASKGASAEGTAMLVHTADCVECDTRMALVPGRSYPPGSMRKVFGVNAAYPRQHSDRAWIYQNAEDLTPVVGEIPQVNSTYGIWESTYGLMNEVGLTLGESSCSSKISCGGMDMPDPKTGEKGPAMMCIGSLMQIALERCKTAVCAIETMGIMAEKYGFFGEGFDEGEALTVADTTGDAWVFHITQDFTTNASAIWVAQRVPEGHLVAIANNYVIQEVPKEPNENFMFSSNIRSEAIAAGLWNGAEPFSWTKTYAKLELPMYGTIRLHWIYTEVAPSLNLPLYESPFDFPFGVPVDEPLHLDEFMQLFRGTYSGKSYDMTKGVLAGPFGNPIRIEGGNGLKLVPGEFTRGISIARTAYMHVGFPLAENPALFYAPDTPTSSVAAPFTAATLVAARDMSLEKTASLYSSDYQLGHKGKFTRDSAWWAFDIVANFMQLNYRNMSVEVVYPMVEEWQNKMIRAYKEDMSLVQVQESLIKSWWEMFDLLIVRYNDGGYNFYPNHTKTSPFATIGYPEDFLKDIKFDKSFVFSQTVQDIVNRECDATDDESLPAWVKLFISFIGGFSVCFGLSIVYIEYRVKPAKSDLETRLI